MSILYDFYGSLLTEKQGRIFTLYHGDNLSLAEIGDELRLSKQGVHDALKKAESALEEFEDKLGLIKTSEYNDRIISEMTVIVDDVRSRENGADIIKALDQIKQNIEKLNH